MSKYYVQKGQLKRDLREWRTIAIVLTAFCALLLIRLAVVEYTGAYDRGFDSGYATAEQEYNVYYR